MCNYALCMCLYRCLLSPRYVFQKKHTLLLHIILYIISYLLYSAMSPPPPPTPPPPPSIVPPLLTGLAGDEHGLHDEREELVQQQVQVEHQRLQAGRGQRHDAQLQLLLQLVLRDLLLAHAQREGGAALQRAAQREEAPPGGCPGNVNQNKPNPIK